MSRPRPHAVLLLLMAAGCAVQAPRSQSAQSASDIAAIRQQIGRYTAAANRGDADGILVVFARDIVLSYPGIPDVTYDSLAAGYRRMMVLPPGTTVRTEPDIEEILVSGDLAAVRVTWLTSTITESSARVEVRVMRDLEIWRRDPDGIWRFARGMHYREPEKR